MSIKFPFEAFLAKRNVGRETMIPSCLDERADKWNIVAPSRCGSPADIQDARLASRQTDSNYRVIMSIGRSSW